MISDKGLLDYVNAVEMDGFENTMNARGVNQATLVRYLFLAKERGLTATTTFGSAPKVLVFDIETLPMECYSWGVGKQFLSPDNIIKEWSVLSWAAKWMMTEEVMYDLATPEEAINRDDKRVCQSLWELFDEADILIAHNGRRFDVRKMNARFIFHEMMPPSPYQTIDTYNDVKSVAAFTSFKQGYLTQFLALEEKLDTAYSLWKRCAVGEQEALDEMLAYNKQDVVGLEDLYLTLRPWLKNHPSMNLYYGDYVDERCPKCGSLDNEPITKAYTTTAGKFVTHRCEQCGGLARKGHNLIKNSAKNLRNLAR